jgi:hypothetical protein
MGLKEGGRRDEKWRKSSSSSVVGENLEKKTLGFPTLG